MSKLIVLEIEKFIRKLENEKEKNFSNVICDVFDWKLKDFFVLSKFENFNKFEEELLTLKKYMLEGKELTRRLVNKLIFALKNLQIEVLNITPIVVFTTKSVKIEFNDNIKKVLIENENECINLAVKLKQELRYLVCANEQEVNNELKKAVDIVCYYEDIIGAINKCYPLDLFTYSRLFIKAKLKKIKEERSKILLTGSSYTKVGLDEFKMPYTAVNLGTDSQDLFYTIESVKEAIKRSEDIEYIVISFAYYFIFTEINKNPSEFSLLVLSRVLEPVYKVLNGYKGTLHPLYQKKMNAPIYEGILSIENERDIYHTNLVEELKNKKFYNEINVRAEGGCLGYLFREKNDAENYEAVKVRTDLHNRHGDLEIGQANKRMLDEFLYDMESLNKKVIFFIPPATNFYKKNICDRLINSFNELVLPVIEKHKCCILLDFFNSEEFSNDDFQDYDHLNSKGESKLTDIIANQIRSMKNYQG